MTNAQPGANYFVEYTVGFCSEQDTNSVLAKVTDTASFTLDDYCANLPTVPNITGVEGGTFVFDPTPIDDA